MKLSVVAYAKIVLVMTFMLLAPSMMWADKEMWVEYANDTLTFHYDENRAKCTNTTYDIPAEGVLPGWIDTYADQVIFEENFKDARPERCTYWFRNQTKLHNINGIEYLNTSEVKDMSYMFDYCQVLRSLDLSHFDTHNVTSMYRMFTYCENLPTLDFKSFSTSKVTNMEEMFYSCHSLTSLDLSSFDTRNVTSMSKMFGACFCLTSVDLSSFDTRNVTDMSVMFDNCYYLTSLDLSTFNTQAVTDMSLMFSNDKQLAKITVSDLFVTDQVTTSTDMFSDCTSLPGFYTTLTNKKTACYYPDGYFTKAVPLTVWVGYDDATTTLTFHYDNTRPASSAVSKYDLPTAGNDPEWLEHKGDITKVVFQKAFSQVQPECCNKWFYEMTSLKEVEGLKYLNTDSVTDMNHMFYDCKSLEAADGIQFNTSKVDNMSYMFYGCESLPTLDITSFDTHNVTDMSYMFKGCSNLSKIYASHHFVADKVTNSEQMFYGCEQLPKHEEDCCDIEVASYNLTLPSPEAWVEYDAESNSITFRYDAYRDLAACSFSLPPSDAYAEWMWKRVGRVVFDESFKDARPVCTKYWFTSLDITEIEGLEYLNTDSVTDMSFMFDGCRNLRSVDVSHFNTKNVTTMYRMFNRCESLKSVDLSSFNTSKVENMEEMFMLCRNLTNLDLSTFDTQNVTNMTRMFYQDSLLEKITTCDLFVTDQVTAYKDMFYDCHSLTGFNTDSIGKDKACYSPEGYFTKATLKSIWVGYDEAMKTLTFHYDNTRLASPATIKYDLPEANKIPKWFERKDDITKVVFDKSFADARPVRCHRWFYWMRNLARIDGIEYLNTDSVNDMSGMFEDCYKLDSINVSHFNTENVTTMRYMFGGCIELKELDLYTFCTSKVDDMSYMFFQCATLKTLDLTSFDTRKVTDMTSMFARTSSIREIKVSPLDFITDQVTNSEDMFLFSNRLPEHEMYHCDLSTAPYNLTYVLPQMWAEYQSATRTLTFHYDYKKDRATATGKYGMPEANVTPAWLQRSDRIEHVAFSERFAYARPVRCAKWFYYMENLTDIMGLEYLNTDSVNDMSYMFYDCQALKGIDLSHFNTSNVTTMTYMFYGCQSLSTIDVSRFNTSKVDDMSYMFGGCAKLTELDLSSFKTDSVTTMSYMFCACQSLPTIDLSSFRTSKVNDMSYMFGACAKLTELDLSHFNTENVTTMMGMFDMCFSLTDLDLNSFRTSKVDDMSYMFGDCGKLTDLDLSSFDTRKVTNMSNMFYKDSLLSYIYVGENFIVSQLLKSEDMFSDSPTLPNFDSTQTDNTRAHYKEGGYLTLRRHFTVGDTQHNIDGYENPICYEDVDFIDGEAYSAPSAFTFAEDATASYTREVKNRWSTLCLPFSFSADNSTARFYYISSYDKDSLGVIALTGTIAAGKPVLAYTEGSEISVSATGVDAVDAPTNTSVDILQGVFTKTEVGDSDYIIANDHFWNAAWLKEKQSATGVYVAPYRAYLSLILSGVQPVTSFCINIAKDETTSIDSIESIEGEASIEDLLNGAELYDLQGRRLSAPQRGMMIVRKGGQTRKVLFK